MIRRPPRSTQSRSSAASDVYKRQDGVDQGPGYPARALHAEAHSLSLIHISEPTRLGMISYAVFCLKKKNKHKQPARRPERRIHVRPSAGTADRNTIHRTR